jgi:hypothetical protein
MRAIFWVEERAEVSMAGIDDVVIYPSLAWRTACGNGGIGFVADTVDWIRVVDVGID